MEEIIIIGAGMAGLACARHLAQAGLRPLVLDKGRGIGGRIATRRVGPLQFDHGAQYVTAHAPGFAALLDELQQDLGLWQDGSGRAQIVGLPGMSDLPRAMARGLEVRQGVQVQRLTQGAEGWTVDLEQGTMTARHVVVTIPAPQVAGLLGADHPLVAALAPVRLAPCLTLMAAVAGPAPFLSRRDPGDSLSWIALDSSKPGRPAGLSAWVAQADEAFSTSHLEASPEEIASLMLPMLCDRIGARPADVAHAQAHRWRHARVTQALGQDFLSRDGLYLGGDWCIGPRVEAAWTSGTAIARAILEAS